MTIDPDVLCLNPQVLNSLGKKRGCVLRKQWTMDNNHPIYLEKPRHPKTPTSRKFQFMWCFYIGQQYASSETSRVSKS